MADQRIFLRSMKLTAFRAYLSPADFDFSQKKCLAVLGPNRHGKTSLVDGLDFIVSDDGTLSRLGLKAAQTKAGPTALAHNGAEKAKLNPEVEIEIVQAGKIASGNRSAAGKDRPRPAAAGTLKANFVVDPIIRGYTMRTFVEDETPESRYKSVAGWLDLGPLVDAQKNLRALRAAIKAEAESRQALDRIDTALKKATANAVPTWDEKAICDHVNATELLPLDKALLMAAMATSDATYVILVERIAAEEKQVGLVGLKAMKNAIEKLYHLADAADDQQPAGLIPALESAAAKVTDTAATEQEEHGKAKDAVFQNVWKAAEPLFAGDPGPEACPVCETPIAASKAGTAGAIHEHVKANLAGLKAYADAKTLADAARGDLAKIRDRLDAGLETAANLLDGHYAACADALKAYRGAVATWKDGASPSAGLLVTAINATQEDLEKNITGIESNQGEQTYAKAKRKIDALIEIGNEHAEAKRISQELQGLANALSTQTATVDGAIRQKVQSLLDRLQTPMNEIFVAIQGDKAPPIKLELPKEDDANQQRLSLLIDFAENRKGVQPGGYLSDSQIHSVALALRLAAILAFNTNAPIVVLDDVVTSYDVDHRRSIVQLLAKMFADHQIVVTTHDERFFLFLKDMLADKDWKFTRITGLDPSFGPRFADHKVTDEMIEARWAQGQSAANEMRQAEEEFLLNLARDFNVTVRIRPLERPYKYDRGELASAVASYLNSAALKPPAVPGVNNRFLNTLQKGEVENFGTHFSDDPGAFPSLGDEKARWEEFKAFRAAFACPKCKSKRFQRPMSLQKPLCAADKCETQFAFAQPLEAAANV